MSGAVPSGPAAGVRERPVRVPLLGVAVDVITLESAVERISAWCGEERAPGELGRARHVVTLNPEMVMAARQDQSLRKTLLAADLVTADGVGIVLAARLRGVRLPGRVTGIDLLESLAARAVTSGQQLFLLGARPGVAEAAAAALERRYPGLRLAGTYAGSPDRVEDAAARTRIHEAHVDVVFVAYGAPAQERWIARNRGQLGAAVALGVGGAFDFLAGRVPRAPRWMQWAGVEWLYRLMRQPWRWRRMLALPRFAVLALAQLWRGEPRNGCSSADAPRRGAMGEDREHGEWR